MTQVTPEMVATMLHDPRVCRPDAYDSVWVDRIVPTSMEVVVDGNLHLEAVARVLNELLSTSTEQRRDMPKYQINLATPIIVEAETFQDALQEVMDSPYSFLDQAGLNGHEITESEASTTQGERDKISARLQDVTADPLDVPEPSGCDCGNCDQEPTDPKKTD